MEESFNELDDLSDRINILNHELNELNNDSRLLGYSYDPTHETRSPSYYISPEDRRNGKRIYFERKKILAELRNLDREFLSLSKQAQNYSKYNTVASTKTNEMEPRNIRDLPLWAKVNILERLDNNSQELGHIGNDDHHEHLRREAEKEDFRVRTEVTKQILTPIERIMLANSGQNEDLRYPRQFRNRMTALMGMTLSDMSRQRHTINALRINRGSNLIGQMPGSSAQHASMERVRFEREKYETRQRVEESQQRMKEYLDQQREMFKQLTIDVRKQHRHFNVLRK